MATGATGMERRLFSATTALIIVRLIDHRNPS
jgi:hypothetical protein